MNNSVVDAVIVDGTVIGIVVGLPFVVVSASFVVLVNKVFVNVVDSLVVDSAVGDSMFVAACVVDAVIEVNSAIGVVITNGTVVGVVVGVASLVVDASVPLLEARVVVDAIVPSVVVSVGACVIDSVLGVTFFVRAIVGSPVVGVVDGVSSVVVGDSALVLVSMVGVNLVDSAFDASFVVLGTEIVVYAVVPAVV